MTKIVHASPWHGPLMLAGCPQVLFLLACPHRPPPISLEYRCGTWGMDYLVLLSFHFQFIFITYILLGTFFGLRSLFWKVKIWTNIKPFLHSSILAVKSYFHSKHSRQGDMCEERSGGKLCLARIDQPNSNMMEGPGLLFPKRPSRLVVWSPETWMCVYLSLVLHSFETLGKQHQGLQKCLNTFCSAQPTNQMSSWQERALCLLKPSEVGDISLLCNYHIVKGVQIIELLWYLHLWNEMKKWIFFFNGNK